MQEGERKAELFCFQSHVALQLCADQSGIVTRPGGTFIGQMGPGEEKKRFKDHVVNFLAAFFLN